MNLEKISERNRIFLGKLRNLSEIKKKVILWTIVAVLGIIMGFFWVNGAINSFQKIIKSAKLIDLPSIDVSSNMPSLDILQTATPSNENIK